mgnify:CR=1 FL=1
MANSNAKTKKTRSGKKITIEEKKKMWQAFDENVDSDTIDELTDYVGYHAEFLKLFGFGVDGVDYDADLNPEVAINNLV